MVRYSLNCLQSIVSIGIITVTVIAQSSNGYQLSILETFFFFGEHSKLAIASVENCEISFPLSVSFSRIRPRLMFANAREKLSRTMRDESKIGRNAIESIAKILSRIAILKLIPFFSFNSNATIHIKFYFIFSHCESKIKMNSMIFFLFYNLSLSLFSDYLFHKFLLLLFDLFDWKQFIY